MGGGIAGPKLANAVSSAGGLGLIGATNEVTGITSELEKANQCLSTTKNLHFDSDSLSTLPVGIGFLIFTTKLEAAIAAVRKAPKPPAVFWLFAAPEPDPVETYAEWTSALRAAFPQTQVWIQIGGGVTVVLKTVQQAKPDVVVVQGSDAGGHGPEVGASLLSVLPETIDALRSAGIKIPVVAAGGIVEARGAAAVLSLGAAGLVLGTRYLAAEEIVLPHPEYQKRIVSTSDGAANTVRAKVFDELKGPNTWPAPYDGRALVSASYKDWKAGASPEEIVSRMKSETDRGEQGDMGFGTTSDRAAIWAGSSVGLVKQVMPAAQITEEVRDGVARVLNELKSRL